MDEPDGFREFVLTRSPAMLRTALMLAGQRASAEDLVQTTLLKVWHRWESITPGGQEAYCRRVLVTTFLRWRGRRWQGETPVSRMPEVASAADDFGAADTRAAVGEALGRLPARQRAAVVLRYVNDLSEADTAQAMNCSVGTVKSQTSKALANLRGSSLRHLFSEESSDDLC